MKPLVLFLLTFLWLHPALAEKFTGRVISIQDGDTITVLKDDSPVKVRLHGIDAPEKKQPFGPRARAFTGKLAFGKTVSIETRDKDRYGRTIGVVTLPDGRILNHELVRAGLAWWYAEYALHDHDLAALQGEAEIAKRGLWNDAAPVAPWEWRASKRNRLTSRPE